MSRLRTDLELNRYVTKELLAALIGSLMLLSGSAAISQEVAPVSVLKT